MNHKHQWKFVGYYSRDGYVNTANDLFWCTECGALKRPSGIINPKDKNNKLPTKQLGG